MDNIKFETELNGYNIEQVDSYIEELKNEILCANIRNECLSNENKKLRDELISVIKTLSDKLNEINTAEPTVIEENPSEKEEIYKSENNKEELLSEEEAKKDFDDFIKELQSVKDILN